MTGEKYWATDPEAGYELATSPVSTVENTYDAAGNRLTQTGSVSGSYTANDLNQYTATVGGATPGYNSRGDLTDFNTQISSDWTFDYDAEGNLITAAHPQEDTITYHYDAFNERAGRTQGTDTEWFLNVGSEMLEAYDVSTGESTSYIYASGIDRPVAQIDELGNVQFLYQDYLGSVVLLTDDAGGVLERYRYNAWGSVARASSRRCRWRRGYWNDRRRNVRNAVHFRCSRGWSCKRSY